MSAGPGLALVAGTMVFGNEWLQTGKINYRVPVAAVGAALALDLIGSFSPKAATGLGVMILIGAASTKFGGKSAIQEITSVLPKQKG